MIDRLVYNDVMKSINVSVSKTVTPRERILLTAHELFYAQGIRATGIDRVIAASGVTKTTFYRHFPSKNELIREYLAYRHKHWLNWFIDALARHGGNVNALVPALSEWFRGEHFRGCAFINSVVELGDALPDVVEITRRHKQDMTDVIAGLLLQSEQQHADALSMAVDGAIIRAQFDQTPDRALALLAKILSALLLVKS